MAASDKVTTYNAYVTGIGASKRVVVWDNTSRDMTRPGDDVFVFGHEMGHSRRSTCGCRSAWRSKALLLQLYFAHRLLGGMLAPLRRALGDPASRDWASLPVLILLLSLFKLVGQLVRRSRGISSTRPTSTGWK
ncbi:MAG: M48 family metalloprotease [Vicinamibacterales bacterium]